LDQSIYNNDKVNRNILQYVKFCTENLTARTSNLFLGSDWKGYYWKIEWIELWRIPWGIFIDDFILLKCSEGQFYDFFRWNYNQITNLEANLLVSMIFLSNQQDLPLEKP